MPSGGIRTRNPSKRAGADPRLRLRSHRRRRREEHIRGVTVCGQNSAEFAVLTDNFLQA